MKKWKKKIIKVTIRHADIWKIGKFKFSLTFCPGSIYEKQPCCRGWHLDMNNSKKPFLRQFNAELDFKGIDLAYLLYTMQAKRIEKGYCNKKTYILKLWYDKERY